MKKKKTCEVLHWKRKELSAKKNRSRKGKVGEEEDKSGSKKKYERNFGQRGSGANWKQLQRMAKLWELGEFEIVKSAWGRKTPKCLFQHKFTSAPPNAILLNNTIFFYLKLCITSLYANMLYTLVTVSRLLILIL